MAVANFKAKQTSIDKDKTTNLHYMLKTKNGFYKIKIENILYLKSDGNYVTVFLEAEQYTCRNKLKDLIAEFNNTQIRKTHRRFAINLSKVTKITKKTVFINNIEIPVSNTHIADIENLLGT